MLLAFAALALLISVNLQRTRTGRAWRALRERDVVAGALGINVQRFKLLAFVISATMTAIAGALFAYFRNFVSIDAFSLYLTVQYVAMIIIGGMGSTRRRAAWRGLCRFFFPTRIEAIAAYLPARFGNMVFALDYAAFGVVMILFLLLEPAGSDRHLAQAAKFDSRCAEAAQNRRRLRDDRTASCSRRAESRLPSQRRGAARRLAFGHAAGHRRHPRQQRRRQDHDAARHLRLHRARRCVASSPASIRFAGERIENRPPHANAARGIVLVPERDKVFPNLTVAENLTASSSARANAGRTPAPGGSRCFSFFRRWPACGRGSPDFSPAASGRCWRSAAPSCASPQLLLVDELSLGLAPVVVEDLARRLAAMRAELGITVLLVEQNANVALTIADYGYILESGRVVLEGAAAELRGRREVQEAYLGQTGGAERRSYRALPPGPALSERPP